MENFIFHNPVKVIFGKGTLAKIGTEAAAHGKKALLVYGKGSIKKNGVYAAVTGSLKAAGVSFAEHEGVKANPVLSHAREGVKKAVAENCDIVIAAGGGSVIDEAKAIAAGAPHNGDLWDFFSGQARINAALPLVCALTLPATGSEMNSGFVLTNEETKQKYGSGSRHSFPKTSILDPETTFSLPPGQTACGAVDALAHLLEAYLTTKDADTRITDELVEGVARAVISSTRRILANPSDYNARASMMWSATLALNGLGGCGYKEGEFLCHAIEHSLSAIYDIAHGAGLAIVMPACFKYQLGKLGPARLAGFGRRVLGVNAETDEETAVLAIESFEKLFSGFGAPVRLKDVSIEEKDIPAIAGNAGGLIAMWGMDYPRAEVEKILRLAV